MFSSSSRRSSSGTTSKLKGQDLFHSRVFQNAESTTIFYQFIASLRQKIRDEVKDTSTTHKLIRTFRDGGRLIRCYTQNIDGLEGREGLSTSLSRGKGNKRRFMKKNYEAPLPENKKGTDFDGGCEVVQLHGDLEKLRCNVCSAYYEWTDEETEIFLEGAAPGCLDCCTKSDARQATGKRGLAVGCLRPNIVLYGEDHPSNALLAPFIPYDAASQPDVLIIMGTSLKVFGLQKIVREFAKAVHAQKGGKGRVIFVNRTRPAESVWDGIIDDFISMDCDIWASDLKIRRPDLWLRQGEIELKVTKSSGIKRKKKDTSKHEEPPMKKAKMDDTIVVALDKDSVSPLIDCQKCPATPQRRQSNYWKHKLDWNYPGRPILSPLAQANRPHPSPLSKEFKAFGEDSKGQFTIPGSPITPAYSPITPRMPGQSRRKIDVLADVPMTPHASIHEGDDDDNDMTQDENSETPSRGPRKQSVEDLEILLPTEVSASWSLAGLPGRNLIGKLLASVMPD